MTTRRLAKNLPSIPLSPPASFGLGLVVKRALPCTYTRSCSNFLQYKDQGGSTWHFVQRSTDDEPETANLLNILPPPSRLNLQSASFPVSDSHLYKYKLITGLC